jgi:hypothetical protein
LASPAGCRLPLRCARWQSRTYGAGPYATWRTATWSSLEQVRSSDTLATLSGSSWPCTTKYVRVHTCGGVGHVGCGSRRCLQGCMGGVSQAAVVIFGAGAQQGVCSAACHVVWQWQQLAVYVRLHTCGDVDTCVVMCGMVAAAVKDAGRGAWVVRAEQSHTG